MLYKKRLYACLCLFFLSNAFAGWNEDFDAQSNHLWEVLPEIQKQEYKNQYEEMVEARYWLLKDGSLKRVLRGLSVDQKSVFQRPREGLIIKKRQYDRIHELYAWEVSFLLDREPSVVPAFPVLIEGKKVIVQKMEPFVFGKGIKELPSSSDIKKVSLEAYWLAHLKAYVLGLGDLLGRNIGISPDGRIRFFDAEYSFFYKNFVEKKPLVIGLGFVAESFEWFQYRKPLDHKTAEILQKFVCGLTNLEDRLRTYEQARGVSLFGEGVCERLQKVRSFAFVEGKTFCDFFATVYPELAPGLDELNQIVSSVYKRKVDHGASLIFLSQHILKYRLSEEKQRQIDAWIDAYVP